MNYFLHCLLRRHEPLRCPFASAFGNFFLRFLFPSSFCSLDLQCLLQLLSAIPLCGLLFITSFCSSCLKLHVAAPVCNSFCSSCLQVLHGTPVCSCFSKLLLAGLSFDLAFVCPLLKLLSLMLLMLLWLLFLFLLLLLMLLLFAKLLMLLLVCCCC